MIVDYPPELPITARHDELLDTIRDHQVVVVAGETGSGKSTQLPKLCLELGRGTDALIGHTQPRRIAARSIAERVAEELGQDLGDVVGYQVRFTDVVSDRTRLKLMTDGILLAEIQHDPLLRRYDTIIIDEAHERSLNIDFLLGWLHQLLPRRPDLKLIITSATIDTQRFAEHFAGPDGVPAPIIEVSGRTFPVELRYRPIEEGDQTDAICDAVVELFRDVPGDVLVFCSGEREIRDATDALTDLALPNTEIVPLYARLSAAEQHRVFAPHRGRRVVVATNVAETSLTVPGIRSVVDPGTARISRFNRRTKVQRLPIEPVSQASANQRAGRCGRVAAGVCIRLYAEDDFAGRPPFTEPEIQRTNLASVILQMATLGLGDVEAFPFVDPPDRASIRAGVALLEELGAVRPGRQGHRDWVTKIGRRLARLPVDPRLGRMLVEAERLGCLQEVRIIVAGLSIQDPRERPTGKEQIAREAHARFADDGSDFLSWIHLWEHLETERRERSSNQFRRMCRNEFLNPQRVREWQDLHSQLRRALSRRALSGRALSGRALSRRAPDPHNQPAHPDVIHRALLSGLLSHVGRKNPDGPDYRGPQGTSFAIAPGSSLFKRNPSWVMSAELVETNRVWARVVARIQPEWLERVGAHLLARSYGDPWWDVQQGVAKIHHSATLYGLPVFTNCIELLHRSDRDAARWFLLSNAFALGEWGARPPIFAQHNRDQRDAVIALEIKSRRDDLLITHERVIEWFDHRVPNDVATVKEFERWWRDKRLVEPHRFDLAIDDLTAPEASGVEAVAFPDEFGDGDAALGLTYVFEPGHRLDGVTIDVPLDQLRSVDAAVFDWLVPGMRGELVEAMLRSLPKPIRKQLLPIADAAHRLLDELEERYHPAPTRPLLVALAQVLGRALGVSVSPEDFDVDRIPSHLRPRFRIVDDRSFDAEAEVLAEGTDLAALRDLLDDRVRAMVTGAGHVLERTDVTTWDFGDLPRSVEVSHRGHCAVAFPSLVVQGDRIDLRLLPSADEQHETMWTAYRRFLGRHRPSLSKVLRPLLTTETKLALIVSPYDSPTTWVDDCVDAAIEAMMVEWGGPAWIQSDFETHVQTMRRLLPDRVAHLASRSLEVLVANRHLQTRLEEAPGAFAFAYRDVRAQRDRMLYAGFIAEVGSDRLDDIARYITAAVHRLERLPEAPTRDSEMMARVRALEADWDDLAARTSWSAELEDVGWLLQELRVTLFAQHLRSGQPGRKPVSEKRVRAQLDRLRTIG
ncbi:MAG: ATP-dependent RNA helicase HrpA [Actinomycetota bacterium]|nr:ATP-dependent RNA helicase HrpA [Actinomycetota bacterium]